MIAVKGRFKKIKGNGIIFNLKKIKMGSPFYCILDVNSKLT